MLKKSLQYAKAHLLPRDDEKYSFFELKGEQGIKNTQRMKKGNLEEEFQVFIDLEVGDSSRAI